MISFNHAPICHSTKKKIRPWEGPHFPLTPSARLMNGTMLWNDKLMLLSNLILIGKCLSFKFMRGKRPSKDCTRTKAIST